MLETVEDFLIDTHRPVFMVQFAGAVYVLHAFQKKSKRGVETPKSDIELIRSRLRLATEHYGRRRDDEERGEKG